MNDLPTAFRFLAHLSGAIAVTAAQVPLFAKEGGNGHALTGAGISTLMDLHASRPGQAIKSISLHCSVPSNALLIQQSHCPAIQ